MDWTWMHHPATRGRQRFAAPAVPAWRDMGWVPCDPPAEPSLALDPNHPAFSGRQVEVTTLADEEPVCIVVDEPAPEPDKTSKIRRRSSASTEEE